MNEDSGSRVEASRREFLKKAGKVVAYMPPIMLALSAPSLAAATAYDQNDTPTVRQESSWHRRTLFRIFSALLDLLRRILAS